MPPNLTFDKWLLVMKQKQNGQHSIIYATKPDLRQVAFGDKKKFSV